MRFGRARSLSCICVLLGLALAAPAAQAQTEDRDCADFANQAAAQAFYLQQGSGDPHRLDGDADGVACELIACPCSTGTPTPPPPPAVPEGLARSAATGGMGSE